MGSGGGLCPIGNTGAIGGIFVPYKNLRVVIRVSPQKGTEVGWAGWAPNHLAGGDESSENSL